ncbi:MAG: amidohydrolase family protein [bacterium]
MTSQLTSGRLPNAAAALAAVEIIDADGHVFERDAELFEFIDEPYKGRETLLGFPFFPALDGFHRGAIHARLGLHAKHETSAAGWLEFLDASGIRTTVLYPSQGVACGFIKDPAWARAVTRAYNAWLSARYLRHSSRLQGMALLPLQDVAAAVAELRRAVEELGMVGAVLPAVGLARPLGHLDLDPLYAEAQRLGCALAVHGGPAQGLGLDGLEKYGQIHALSHPSAQMLQLTSVVMNGVFDRFPELRMAFLEGGAGWVPFLMDRMDRSYEVRRFPEYTGGTRHVPSWYVRECGIYFGVDLHERTLGYTAEVVGAEHLLFCSDFPHEVNLARCRDELHDLATRADLSPAARAAILGDNARRFYRL